MVTASTALVHARSLGAEKPQGPAPAVSVQIAQLGGDYALLRARRSPVRPVSLRSPACGLILLSTWKPFPPWPTFHLSEGTLPMESILLPVGQTALNSDLVAHVLPALGGHMRFPTIGSEEASGSPF